MSQVVSRMGRGTSYRRSRPASDRAYWMIAGAVGGACAGWLALEIGLVFCFDLGWNGIHANLKSKLSEPVAVAHMRAGLAATFGLIAAMQLGVLHAVLRGRLFLKGVAAWMLIGVSAGVLCWVVIETFDRYIVEAKATEHLVWALVWAIIGGVVGASLGARYQSDRAASDHLTAASGPPA